MAKSDGGSSGTRPIRDPATLLLLGSKAPHPSKVEQPSIQPLTRMDGHNPFLTKDEDTLRKLLFHHEYSASSIRAALKFGAADSLEDPPAKLSLDEVAKLASSLAALESSTKGGIT